MQIALISTRRSTIIFDNVAILHQKGSLSSILLGNISDLDGSERRSGLVLAEKHVKRDFLEYINPLVTLFQLISSSKQKVAIPKEAVYIYSSQKALSSHGSWTPF